MEKVVQILKKLSPRDQTLIVFITVMVFYSITLMRYPAPWFDEPLYVSRAWSSLHSGQVIDLWAAGAFDRFEGYWTILSWLLNGFLMIGLLIAGSPSLFASRLVVLFFGFWLLVAAYWIGKKFGGYPLAILGVIMVALSRAFLVSSHLVRPDIIGAAFGYAAIAIYLNNSHSRWWASSAAGLLAVMAFEIHANGAFFIPVILTLFLVDHGKHILKQRSFWSFCLGCLVGGCIYLIIHVLLYPETYQAIMVSIYAEAYRPPILMMNPAELWYGLAYYWKFMLTRYVLLFPVLILALLNLLKRRSEADKTFFTLVIVILIGYAWWVRWKFGFYEIYFVPILQILLASYLLDFIKRPRENTLVYRISFVYVWTAYLSISLVNIIPAILNNDYPAYEQVQQRVNQSIQPGDTILGTNIFWFGLSENRYYSIDQISFDRWFDPSSTLEKDFNRIRPDIFIYDDQARLYTTDNSSDYPYAGYIYIPKTELEAFLANHANLVDTFNGIYGLIEIYHIDWEN